jgi:hypothetical protein
MNYLNTFAKAVGFAGLAVLAACNGGSDNRYFSGVTSNYSFQITETPLYRNGQRTNERMNEITFRPRDNTARFASIAFDDFNGNKKLDGKDGAFARDYGTGASCSVGDSRRVNMVPCEGETLDAVLSAINEMAVAPTREL